LNAHVATAARFVLALRDRCQIDMDVCRAINIKLAADGVWLSLAELDRVAWLSEVIDFVARAPETHLEEYAEIARLRQAVTEALRECERCDHEAARRILREVLPW